jgi:hypothetical protein
MFCVADRVADGIRSAIPQPTEWQHIGNEIDAAMICYTGGLRNGCLISLTIFSFVSLASLGPRIAIGTPDH